MAQLSSKQMRSIVWLLELEYRKEPASDVTLVQGYRVVLIYI